MSISSNITYIKFILYKKKFLNGNIFNAALFVNINVLLHKLITRVHVRICIEPTRHGKVMGLMLKLCTVVLVTNALCSALMLKALHWSNVVCFCQKIDYSRNFTWSHCVRSMIWLLCQNMNWNIVHFITLG